MHSNRDAGPSCSWQARYRKLDFSYQTWHLYHFYREVTNLRMCCFKSNKAWLSPNLLKLQLMLCWKKKMWAKCCQFLGLEEENDVNMAGATKDTHHTRAILITSWLFKKSWILIYCRFLSDLASTEFLDIWRCTLANSENFREKALTPPEKVLRII